METPLAVPEPVNGYFIAGAHLKHVGGERWELLCSLRFVSVSEADNLVEAEGSAVAAFAYKYPCSEGWYNAVVPGAPVFVRESDWP